MGIFIKKITKQGEPMRKRIMDTKNMFWLMALGCLLPIAAIFILPAIGVNLGSSAWLLLIILCPVSHLFMMRGMHHWHHDVEIRGDENPDKGNQR
jgi:hypothetical protein